MYIRRVAIAASVIGLALSEFVLSAQARPQCREVELTRKPGWTISGLWTTPPAKGGSSELLLVDALNYSVLRYSDLGESLGPVGDPLRSTLRHVLPVFGKSWRDGLILDENSEGFLILDSKLRPTTERSAVVKSVGGSLTLNGLWQWEPVGEEIFGFGDVNGPSADEWHAAFVRFPIRDPRQFSVLKTVEMDDPERMTYFRTGYPNIAAIGSTAYILSMSQGTVLYKNEPASKELEVLPAFPRQERPRWPVFDKRSDYVELMKSIEDTSAPVGLYSSGNSLFVLFHVAPRSAGSALHWVLRGVDPSTGGFIGRPVELPTKANHLTVIPGPKYWAFVEKGPVKAWAAQDASKVLLIPSEQFLSSTQLQTAVCPFIQRIGVR